MNLLMDLDELVEHWTLLEDEHPLVSGKRGPTRIGFAMLLKFYVRRGRFPESAADLPGEAVKFVARQIGAEPWELDAYEWSGRTIEYHRSQIREHLGFRECSVRDADELVEWLASHVCQVERRPDQVRELMLDRCRAVRIEPPTAGRTDRIVRSALHQGELALTGRIAARIAPDVAARHRSLITFGGNIIETGTDSYRLAHTKNKQAAAS